MPIIFFAYFFPDPYLWLMDPDPGGPKTCGSRSPTLIKRISFTPAAKNKAFCNYAWWEGDLFKQRKKIHIYFCTWNRNVIIGIGSVLNPLVAKIGEASTFQPRRIKAKRRKWVSHYCCVGLTVVERVESILDTSSSLLFFVAWFCTLSVRHGEQTTCRWLGYTTSRLSGRQE
jgi:hypothetical protein